MANPEYQDPTKPQDVTPEPEQPETAVSHEGEQQEAPPSGDEAEQVLDEFTKDIDGAKFSSFDDLLEYILLLNDLPDTKEDMAGSKYDLRNTRFMRALKIFIEYLNAHNWFAVWDSGEAYPLDIEGVSKDKKTRFDPKTRRPEFNPEWYQELYNAILKFFTAAPGLSEDFAPQHGPNAGKVTKAGNRTKYIKQHLGQIQRIAEKRGEERAFNKMVSWLHNIYLAGSGLGTSRFEYQDPYKYLYDDVKRDSEGLYIYESKEDAIASLIGAEVSQSDMQKIMGSHKKGVWLGLAEGYNDLPPGVDPRDEYKPESGYGPVAPEEVSVADLPPRARAERPDMAPINQFMDGQACEMCGCNPCGCEAPVQPEIDQVAFTVSEPSDAFGPCPICGAPECGCVEEDMAVGNAAFFDEEADCEMDECLEPVKPDLEVNEEMCEGCDDMQEELLSKKASEIKGSNNETDELSKASPDLKGGVSREGGKKGLEGGKKPAPTPKASV